MLIVNQFPNVASLHTLVTPLLGCGLMDEL